MCSRAGLCGVIGERARPRLSRPASVIMIKVRLLRVAVAGDHGRCEREDDLGDAEDLAGGVVGRLGRGGDHGVGQVFLAVHDYLVVLEEDQFGCPVGYGIVRPQSLSWWRRWPGGVVIAGW